MIRVRAEINLSEMPAGTEHDVDETDEWVAAQIKGGLLSPVHRPDPIFCLDCSPPQFFDSEDGLAAHKLIGFHQGVEERDGATG